MIRPAFTNVVGTYPEKENEIMLSTKTLQYLGIKNPEVGMEIELDFIGMIFQYQWNRYAELFTFWVFYRVSNQTSGASVAFYQRNQWRRTDFNGSHVGF